MPLFARCHIQLNRQLLIKPTLKSIRKPINLLITSLYINIYTKIYLFNICDGFGSILKPLDEIDLSLISGFFRSSFKMPYHNCWLNGPVD